MAAYMLASAGMSVFNKLAIEALNTPKGSVPITLVIIQMLFTVATLMMKVSSIHIGSRRDALRWGLTVPLLFAAMLVTSMVSFEYNTLGTVVVFRNVAPIITLFVERLFRVPMVISLETVASLVCILAGVVLYHLNALGLTTLGLLSICLNMMFAVLERLAQRYLMAQDPVDINKPGMMMLNNAFGVLPCAMLMVGYQEPGRWGAVSERLSAGGVALVLITCLNGLAISYAGLKVQQMVTATTFMVLTNVNKFVVIFFGVVALGDALSLPSLLGVCLALGGGVWYGRARARVQRREEEAAAKQRERDEEAQGLLPPPPPPGARP